MADFFAKESILNPKCMLKELPLPISHLKSTIKAKSSSAWVNRWQKSSNGQITHSFIPDIIPKHLISKTFSHKLTQVLTGHCKLNFFLNNIGKTLDPSCPCGKGIETVHHYLWVCQLEAVNRTNTIRKAYFSQGIPYPPKITFFYKIKSYSKHCVNSYLILVASICKYIFSILTCY